MNIDKPELILGTAELGPTPYGLGVTTAPSEQEIVRILNRAWEGGIRTLDTSDQYGTDMTLFAGFKLLHKTRTVGEGVYHYKEDEARIPEVKSASIYIEDQIPEKPEVLIIPAHVHKREFLRPYRMSTRVYIRSVFDRGRLLPAYTVKECLDFVKRQRVHGVIIGVNSLKELDEILEVW